MTHTILIVDDEDIIRATLRGILEDESYRVLEAASGEEALGVIQERWQELSAVMLDIWMDGIDGIETLRRVKEIDADLPVVMMSGHGNVDTAVSATRIGAYDYLEKPLSLERVLLLLERAIRELSLVRENRALKHRSEQDHPLVGESEGMQRLKEQIGRVAPTGGWVLITGENGTGKEVAARRIHQLSDRADKPFITVSSAAIPEELIESELFGHEKGAIPGAVSAHAGYFEQGDGGTLFLDEIGDMSLKTQAKILRLLQEQRFERLGGNRQIRVNVRVIAASNKNLEQEIAQGRFRRDLFYRLNVIPIHVPPLREHPGDIPALVEHFTLLQKGALPQRVFNGAALDLLKAYQWPGNVRELKNLVERLLIMAPGNTIQPSDLPDFIAPRSGTGGGGASPGGAVSPWEALLNMPNLREAREEFERAYLKGQLDRLQGNIARTADAVGMERSALYRKLKALGLD